MSGVVGRVGLWTGPYPMSVQALTEPTPARPVGALWIDAERHVRHPADDIVPLHQAEPTRVQAVITVVAQYQVLILTDMHGAK